MKNQTRPDYWVPDENSPNCQICKFKFGDELNSKSNNHTHKGTIQIDNYLHHCRACGGAVCSLCSREKIQVLDRGWFENVRVCDICFNERKSKKE